MKSSLLILSLLLGLIAVGQDSVKFQIQSEIEFPLAFCGATPEYTKKMNDAYTASKKGPVNPSIIAPFDFVVQNQYPVDSIEHCGIFNLYYDDKLYVPAAGFVDPVLGAARRATLCAVLNQIQSTINIPAGTTIDIFVDRSFSTSNQYNGTGGFLAFAGPTYPTNFTAIPGIYNGSFFNHVTTGNDPDPNNYDMSVTTNFHRYYAGGTYHNINYYDDYNNLTGTCRYDLFTVLLHEITHGMGLLSFVSEDQTNHNAVNGNSGNIYNNAYSKYDADFLYKGDILTGTFNKLVNATNPNAPFINPVINTTADPLRSNDIWLYNNGNPLNQPVYSGNYYVQQGWITNPNLIVPNSLISHLGLDLTSFQGMSQYSPGSQERYVMGPTIDWNEFRRTWVNPEIRCLLNLGYTLNPAYAATSQGNTILNNVPPRRTNPAVQVTAGGNNIAFVETPSFDYVITNNNSPTSPNVTSLIIPISTLPNIADQNGDQISIMPNSLFGLRGVSTGGNNHNLLVENVNGTTVTYTPEAGYCGIAQFGFYLWDGHERGAFKTITINVLHGNYIPTAGNELIINGDFEDGTEIKTTTLPNNIYSTLESGVIGNYFEGTHFAGGQPYSFLSNWWGPHGAGKVILGALNDCSNTIGNQYPNFGDGNSAAPSALNGSFIVPINTIPVNNERYTRTVYSNEPIFYRTMDSLRNGRYYILEFDIAFANVPSMANTAIGDSYTYSLSGISNPVGSPWTQTVNYSYSKTRTVQDVCHSGDNDGHWVHIIDTFQYCGLSSIYLRFYTATLSNPPFSYSCYDNFSLRQDVNHPNLSSVISNGTTILCGNTSANLTATPDFQPTCPIIYTWQPGGMTGQSIVVSPTVTTIYTVTATSGSVTVTDTAKVTVYQCGANCTSVANITIPNGSQSTGLTIPNGSLVDVQGTFIINSNVSYNNVKFRMAPNAIINVNPNITLTLKGCQFFSCTDMWQGIFLANNTSVINAGKCTFEDAIGAITSNNGGVYSVLKCIFNKNYVGIEVNPYAGYNGSTVQSSTFNCVSSLNSPGSTLKFPYLNVRSRYGIEILSNQGGITIGLNGTNAVKNTFQNIDIGIHSYNSRTRVFNNDFLYLNRLCHHAPGDDPCSPDGWGIWAENYGSLTVGDMSGTQLFNNNSTNNFKYCDGGIFVNQHVTDININKNWFYNIGDVSNLYPNNKAIFIAANYNSVNDCNILNNKFSFDYIGIQYENNKFHNMNINSNKFNSCSQYAVYCRQNYNGSSFQNMTIESNEINDSTGAGSIYGIVVQNAVTNNSPRLDCKYNYIKNVQRAIWVTKLDKPDVHYNNPNYTSVSSLSAGIYFPNSVPSVGNPNYGIAYENCTHGVIEHNSITKQGGNPSTGYIGASYGISVASSNVGNVNNNTVYRMGTGFNFHGAINQNVFTCNLMSNNRVGLAIDNSFIGDQGNSITAEDDQWAIPSGSGWVSASNNTTTFPYFYTRSYALPFMSSTNLPVMQPALAIHPQLVTGNPSYTCDFGCASPPCININILKLAKRGQPFDNLTTEQLMVADFKTLQLLRQSDSLTNTGTPSDTVLISYMDSLNNTNTGLLVKYAEKMDIQDSIGAKQDLLAVQAQLNPEVNTKIVYSIYYNTWAKDIFYYSTEDSAQLLYVAQQNPLEGGMAVYDARVMLGYWQNDFTPYNSGSTGAKLVSNGDKIDVESVEDDFGVLYPNPAQNVVNYNVDLGDGNSGKLEIFDALGRTQYKTELTVGKNQLTIDTEKWENGIYFYRLLINGEYKTGKTFIISK